MCEGYSRACKRRREAERKEGKEALLKCVEKRRREEIGGVKKQSFLCIS